MTHSHPLPDNTALCPYCSTDPGVCCRVLAHQRAKRKRKRLRQPTPSNTRAMALQEAWERTNTSGLPPTGPA